MNKIFQINRVCYLLIFLLFAANASAQINKPGFSASVNLGGNQAFTDVDGSDLNITFGAGLNYYVTPFLGIKTEVSHGNLSRKLLDRNYKNFNNTYNYLNSTVNVALGQFLKPSEKVAHYMLYNLYMGTGLGLISSNIKEPNNVTPDNQGGVTYKGTDITVPVNIGVDFKFLGFYYTKSPLSFNLNYQHSFAFTEMLDGYDPPTGNNSKDSFGNFTAGVKYQFSAKK
ncbi:outer membrane beta-barrel protein [Daejeonella oryzae]|uniref:outer membrane beta-barrel protein n=1 Tax=Daejeonella oryzae TaxID=1122943 RepID=UPI000409C574|nr:outer membrane beta-barrel protein [Daejeonella oryzae]